MNEKLLGQFRHGLTLLMGYVVGKGWIPSDLAGELVTWVIVGLPFVWSWLAKRSPSIAAIAAEVDTAAKQGTTNQNPS